MKNFHLPLPERTYAELRAEAERSRAGHFHGPRRNPGVAAGPQESCARRAVAAYAAEMAGTEFDLNQPLEAATVDVLLENEAK